MDVRVAPCPKGAGSHVCQKWIPPFPRERPPKPMDFNSWICKSSDPWFGARQFGFGLFPMICLGQGPQKPPGPGGRQPTGGKPKFSLWPFYSQPESAFLFCFFVLLFLPLKNTTFWVTWTICLLKMGTSPGLGVLRGKFFGVPIVFHEPGEKDIFLAGVPFFQPSLVFHHCPLCLEIWSLGGPTPY